MHLLKAIFSRRWIVATMLVIVGMAVMMRLGVWQLDRLAQRRAANAVLTAVLASEPLTLADMSLPTDPSGLKDRQVMANGAFDLERQVVLLVQNWNGRAGVHLITPFLIAGDRKSVV